MDSRLLKKDQAALVVVGFHIPPVHPTPFPSVFSFDAIDQTFW
jgi:hypothetical protein